LRDIPTRIEALSNIIAISAGGDHGLALDSDGRIWGFGRNDLGQLGIGNQDAFYTTPQLNFGILERIQQISSGLDHNLALDRESQLWSFGSNQYGQVLFFFYSLRS
jgi:alpha-tubulin suppressor-like RCC1 family protein